jgi:ABC-type amino acid transport substrate-binding protein
VAFFSRVPKNNYRYQNNKEAMFMWIQKTAKSFISSGLAMLLLGAAPLTVAEDQTIKQSSITTIKLWNGNKTPSRQTYEREVLEAALTATKKQHGTWELIEDKTDYPLAEDEASVFREKGFDIFGTVAGNAKLASEKKILIPMPLMKGLLGYRILIIRAEDKAKFAAIKSAEQLQELRMGIPSTWADAELFRHNGYKVEEKGSFNDLFLRLENNEFDYVTFGANEITGVFCERAARSGKLAIDSSLLVFYPFPLVFYVNPENETLAQRVKSGLQIISANGELDVIFNRYFAEDLKAVNLPARTMIQLKNPILPAEMANFKPAL